MLAMPAGDCGGPAIPTRRPGPRGGVGSAWLLLGAGHSRCSLALPGSAAWSPGLACSVPVPRPFFDHEGSCTAGAMRMTVERVTVGQVTMGQRCTP